MGGRWRERVERQGGSDPEAKPAEGKTVDDITDNKEIRDSRDDNTPGKREPQGEGFWVSVRATRTRRQKALTSRHVEKIVKKHPGDREAQ